MAALQWFINVNGQNIGPLTEEEIRSRLKTGAISPATPAWREGLAGWMPVGNSELMSGVPIAPNFGGGTLAHGDYPERAGATEGVYGGFWLRFVAYLIDALILFVPGCFINLLVAGRAVLTETFTPEWFVATFFGWTLAIAYFGVLQAKMEGTLGKRVVGLRLVSETLGPISVSQALFRYVMLVVSAIPVCAGLIAVGLDPRKQGWHDRTAKTLVVQYDYLVRARVGAQSPASTENAGGYKRAA